MKKLHVWLARRELGIVYTLLLLGYAFMFVMVLNMLGNLR